MTTDELESYDRILPGLAGRIITMAEVEARHRQLIDRRRRLLSSKLERVGQAFGLFMAGYIVALSLLDFAYHLVHTGQYVGLRFYVF